MARLETRNYAHLLSMINCVFAEKHTGLDNKFDICCSLLNKSIEEHEINERQRRHLYKQVVYRYIEMGGLK